MKLKQIILFIPFLLTFGELTMAGVKDFDRKISVALVSVKHNYTLGIESNLENIERRVDWRANTASLTGFELSYKWLTLAYLTTNELTEQDIESKGRTSYEDLRGGLFLGHEKQFVLLGYYNRFKGFYLQNSQEIDPSYVTTFIQRKDIQTFNSGAALMYIFDPKDFSAAAAYVQSAQQTDSGGSWILLLSFDANIIDADTDLIPDSVESDFGAQQDLRSGKFATLSLSVGYAYTLVWNKFFLNLTAILGRGFQENEYTFANSTIAESRNSQKFAMGYSLGYNGDFFYAGFSYVQDDNNFKLGTVRLSPHLNSSRIFIGTRF